MTDYRVELEAYSGPMDLLLYLVRKHEIDLNDIPIAKLTEQYLAHLQQMREMNFELAGEFLVMAATLLEIKSQMLAPRLDQEGQQGQGCAENALSELDPRYELVQQLLAYKRFKDLAGELESRQHEWAQRFAHLPPRAQCASGDGTETQGDQALAGQPELDLDDISVHDLCEAFARILETIGSGPLAHQVVYDDTPISMHAADLLDRLQRDAAGGAMTLAAIFAGRSRGEAIGLFLAMLELVRQRRVRVYQDDAGQIQIELDQPEPDQPQMDPAIKWRDPQTGEVQYEWPDEQSRLRALHRAQLRLARLKGDKTDQAVAGDTMQPAAENAEMPKDTLDSGERPPLP